MRGKVLNTRLYSYTVFLGAFHFIRASRDRSRRNRLLQGSGLTDLHRRLIGAAAFPLLMQLPCAAFPYDAHPVLMDARVNQETVTSTICQRGHISHVLPSIDEQIRLKDKLLEERGIDPSAASGYALDFRLPVLLGGSPDALANRDILPWEGNAGERRKRRLTVFLRHCVCSGELSLARAQAAISGDWSHQYSNLWALACKDVR